MISDRVLEYLGWSLLILAIVLFKFASQLMDNIIRSNSFLILYGAIGLILAIGVIVLIYRLRPGFFEASDNRGRAGMGYLLGISALCLFGFAQINRDTGISQRRNIKAFVTKKVQNTMYGTTYVFLRIGEIEERFQPKKEQWEPIGEGDSIELEVGRGVLGYEHIYSFRPVLPTSASVQSDRSRQD